MKKVLILVFLIMFIITSFKVMNSFALYKNQLVGNYSDKLGVWLIKVNENEISSGTQTVEFELPSDYIKHESEGYVSNGKIAPGSEMYFELIIDATSSDVSVQYELTIGNLPDASILFTRVENEFQLGNDTIPNTGKLITSTNTYESVIPMDKITSNYLNVVKVHFKWQNQESKNDKDTELGSHENPTANQFKIPIKMHLIQYTGEEEKS